MTLKFPVHIPFVEQLGFELVSVGAGEAELRVDLTEAHLNSWSVAHGGVVMTLLDVAMAHAARSPQKPGDGFGPGVVTIEMKTSFMRPGEGRLRGLGRLLHRTATMAFCEGSVLDEQGRLCAHATGTFKFLKALPGRDKAIKPLRGPAGAAPD
ncbi:MAG: PaaI family thioesterase [Burkholderiaceae bacterium]